MKQHDLVARCEAYDGMSQGGEWKYEGAQVFSFVGLSRKLQAFK